MAPLTPLENKWRWIERIIYIATILVGIVLFFRNQEKERTQDAVEQAADRAVFDKRLEQLEENQKDMLKKMNEFNLNWKTQAEINGQIVMYMRLDANK